MSLKGTHKLETVVEDFGTLLGDDCDGGRVETVAMSVEVRMPDGETMRVLSVCSEDRPWVHEAFLRMVADTVADAIIEDREEEEYGADDD